MSPLGPIGSVPGTVLNQYSVDEQGSYLRIATTETAAPTGAFLVPSGDAGLSNSVYVLTESGGVLSVVGSLTGIAPGERIFATRFFGDRAYVVTFRQFDPLFAIDLSDPTAPKLAGSLEIPGFSRYLQPIDATHVIGIGQQVVNNEPSNVQVSLFDVSDLANPRRVGVTTVSTGDSYWMTTSEHYDAHQVAATRSPGRRSWRSRSTVSRPPGGRATRGLPGCIVGLQGRPRPRPHRRSAAPTPSAARAWCGPSEYRRRPVLDLRGCDEGRPARRSLDDPRPGPDPRPQRHPSVLGLGGHLWS